MGVAGHYKDSFSEATHCLFNGNLNDPDFCRVAIQTILGKTAKTITLSVSGEQTIKRKGDKEYIALVYPGFFGAQKTTGHPFKDEHTGLPDIEQPIELSAKPGDYGTSLLRSGHDITV